MLSVHTTEGKFDAHTNLAFTFEQPEGDLLLLANGSNEMFGSRHQPTVDFGVRCFMEAFDGSRDSDNVNRLVGAFSYVEEQFRDLGTSNQQEQAFTLICVFASQASITVGGIGSDQAKVFRAGQVQFASTPDVVDVRSGSARVITGARVISSGVGNPMGNHLVTQNWSIEAGDTIVIANYRLFALGHYDLIVNSLSALNPSEALCRICDSQGNRLTDAAIVCNGL